MHHRITQHRHHHPQPPVEDLRMRLNRMRVQRETDEAAGIPPSEDSYIHNLPKHERHAGYPNERRSQMNSGNRTVGQTEWEQGKVINIKVQVNEGGERMLKMDKDQVFTIAHDNNSQLGPLFGNLIKNEKDLGIKSQLPIRGRGRGGFRGAPRARGFSRGRGRGFRSRGSWGRGRGRGTSFGDTASTSSEVTQEGSVGSGELGEQEHDEHVEGDGSYDDCNGEEYSEEYHEGEDGEENAEQTEKVTVAVQKTPEKTSEFKEEAKEVKIESVIITNSIKSKESVVAEKPALPSDEKESASDNKLKEPEMKQDTIAEAAPEKKD